MKTFLAEYAKKSLCIGTYKSDISAIFTAIEGGYRYFDTASYYMNEEKIAQAIHDTRIPRSEFIIASKLWKSDMGFNNAKLAFERTLTNLQTDYLDVYFIHWPADNALNVETWHALEELYLEGKIRALGLSNFLPYHAEAIVKACKIFPVITQLEFHPGYTQPYAVKYYQEHNILVQAWSPLARGRVFQDKLILELAEKYQATPAQICISFCCKKGVMPIVKASSSERLSENLAGMDIDLELEDIMRIENMPPVGWSGEHPDRERVKININ